MSEHYQVIVVGGGIVGATTASLLASEGIKTALLDSRMPQLEWPEGTVANRVSAITRASQNIFQHLAIWPHVQKLGAVAYQQMRVWDDAGDGELHFDNGDCDFDELGFIVENRVLTAALWQKMASLPALTVICPAQVQAIPQCEQGRRILLQDGKTLTAELIIAADGNNSSLRTQLGIALTGWPYQQEGLVATVNTANGHQATAWQRFLADGPLAFLPLYTGQCSIVWSLPPEKAQHYLQLEDAAFLQELHKASAGILGEIQQVADRASFPLRFQYAKQYTREHFALVGDAAHTMHPLAGQGANAGLLDAAAISELIITANRQRRPIGGKRVLRKYERWRKGDNLLMMTAMDVLKRTYGVSSEPFVHLRSAGMNGINRTALIRNQINRYAMGLRDDLPVYARCKVNSAL